MYVISKLCKLKCYFQVCPTEIIAFSDQIDKFKAINCEVVGVSTDSHFSHLAWINLERKKGGLGELKYPLLSDFSRKISDNYGVLIPDAGIALQGLFIIDPNVIIKMDNGILFSVLKTISFFTQGCLRQMSINDLPGTYLLFLLLTYQYLSKVKVDCNL